MIHFLRPYWLLLLLPALCYVLWIIYAYKQNNPWKHVCDPHLLPSLLHSNNVRSRFFFNLALISFFMLSILALAGPALNKTQLPLYRELNSLLLILDLSPAMQDTDLKPNRLSRAKFKIRDLIHAQKNTQMGLVVFTEEAFVVSPLSQDAYTLSAMIDELNPQMMPILGSDIGEGLSQGLKLLNQVAPYKSNLLLITASEPTANSFMLAKKIVANGSHLNVLAVLESNPNTQTIISKLQQLAQLGGGSLYLFTPDSGDIQSLLNHEDMKQRVKDEKSETVTLWQDSGPWLCLFLIPFALLVLREKG